jgi:DNA-binding beta-propeller fold protein YncE
VSAQRITNFFSVVAFAALAVACGKQPVATQDKPESSGAVAVLNQANTLPRLIERSPPPTAAGGEAPSFVVDPAWPKPLPNNWILGDIGGLFVDQHDHIWVYHRPRGIDSTNSGAQGEAGKDEKGNPVSALGHPRPYGRLAACCTPAPSVLEFDKAGTLIQAWGGPADPGFLEKRCRQEDGCFWPAREHGIFVDHNEFVYVAGNGQAKNFHGQFPWAANFGNDSHILKFKKDGTFVSQLGLAGAKGPNSNDTNGANGSPQPFWPADMRVDPQTNVMFIADGYGNRRVLMVDAATGKYVGHFGAYGQNPVLGENSQEADAGEGIGSWPAEFARGEMQPKTFRSPLHCAVPSNDGFVYVCDRANNRVQVFNAKQAGKPCTNPQGEVGRCGFVGEIHVAPQTAMGTAGAVSLSSDPEQSCLYIADIGNDTIYVVNRKNLQELRRVGTGGNQAGQFHWPHVVSVDSEGNLYTGEVDGSARVQKFLRYGSTGCSGTGSAEIGKYL